MTIHRKFFSCFFICHFYFTNVAVAIETTNPIIEGAIGTNDAVSERAKFEKQLEHNPFSVMPYQPIYMLPFYYTSAVSIADKHISPDKQKFEKINFKFQISLKSPVWSKFFNFNNALYIAYTQQSYWQAYTKAPFLRTSDLQPEIFLENNINLGLPFGWSLWSVTPGVVHQSNGLGGTLERSWNRVYGDVKFSHGNLLICIKPWIILPHTSLEYNRDIGRFMGDGILLVSYKVSDQVVSFSSYNNMQTRFRRGSAQFTWSFPLMHNIHGYTQIFTGYGQTLLEYNQRTDTVGLGIVLSDWL